MAFNSYEFLFGFLPVVFCGYFFLGKWSQLLAGIWLSMASLFFYGYGDLRALPLLVSSIVCNYYFGARLSSSAPGAGKYRRVYVYIAICANLTVLGFFKYANFLIRTINILLLHANYPPIDEVAVALPVGISFFTFTQIAFLADCYQQKVREQKFLHYGLFVTYFPHLVAGPIIHHSQMMPQFARASTYRMDPAKICLGLVAFTLGLAKKVILADWIGQYSDLLFRNLSQGVAPTLINSWTGALAYAFQIYYDFSGYSDMAVGLSLLFGVVLPINFNSPYKATDIIDFWRRWHISLSTFLRDYLYIPLGGNRLGGARRYLNLIVTMLLGGLWHGASWTFVLWGGVHGFFLAVNHAWRKLFSRSTRIPSSLPKVVGWGVTSVSVVFAWVLFRAGTLREAMDVYRGMLGMNGIALPVPLAGRVHFLPAWLRIEFIGIWNESIPAGMSATEGIGLVILCTVLSLILPNTADLIGTEIRLDQGNSAGQMPLFRRRKLAFGLGVLFVVSILSLHRVTRFIYFQF